VKVAFTAGSTDMQTSALTVDGEVLRLFWELAAVESAKREVSRLPQPGCASAVPSSAWLGWAAGQPPGSSKTSAGGRCSARLRHCGSPGRFHSRRVRDGVAGCGLGALVRRCLYSTPMHFHRGACGSAAVAPLVSYSLRRLARGLSSGREVRLQQESFRNVSTAECALRARARGLRWL